MMRLSRCNGTPNIGVYASVNESLALVAANSAPGFVEDVETVLGVETILTTISGSFVLGSLIRMNSNGAVVSGMVESTELERIKEKIHVTVLRDKVNAAGNNVLANDHGAIINPKIGASAEKKIAEALGVQTVRSEIAGFDTVGSACVATNKGCLCNVNATDEDIGLIRDILRVNVVKGSVNHGSKHVGAGILSNSKGALVGDDTTPIEMGKIEDGLVLY
ncbi:translation initiation factor 6 [Candidatus Methanoplasma termitum]|uniref:Translation initiation factor 6 n=1 Tax=Candidatus Methanoplasma termitum TaxID=1577791 RepID=A0A0A7LB26_9ARCH|nr:translation initiation factor IF-6 [Candidatus Methanoplasma termitum]AIZ56365.1 translation initiation factor 6 [Candidatus Methanoplasma termitum]